MWMASLKRLQNCLMSNMQLSGTLPGAPSKSYQSLEVLSLTRNYLTGHGESLAAATSLKTLLISSNRLSCNAVGLDESPNLASGDFMEPSIRARYS